MAETIKIGFKELINNLMVEPRRITHLIQTHGDVITLKLPTTRMPLIANPKFIKTILIERPQTYIRSYAASANFNLILGSSGLTAIQNHAAWQANRKNLTPLFQPEQLKRYTEIMIKSTNEFLNTLASTLDAKKPINIDTMFTKITLNNLINSLFCGVKTESETISVLLRDLLYWSLPHLYVRYIKLFGIIPVPYFYSRYQSKKKQLDDIVTDIVLQSCKESIPTDNVIKYILKSKGCDRYEQLDQNTKDYLHSEALTFLFGGHETLVALLGHICMHLSRHPHLADKVYEEVNAVIGDHLPTNEDLKKLTYTLAFIKESLRVSPPVLAMLRTCVKDDTIDNYQFKKDELLIIPIYTIQRLPQFWENPEGFDPTRFLKPLSAEQQAVYLPFGQGERMCIGMNYGLMEVLIIVSLMVKRFKFELMPGHILERDPKSMVNRYTKIMMTLHQR